MRDSTARWLGPMLEAAEDLPAGEFQRLLLVAFPDAYADDEFLQWAWAHDPTGSMRAIDWIHLGSVLDGRVLDWNHLGRVLRDRLGWTDYPDPPHDNDVSGTL